MGEEEYLKLKGKFKIIEEKSVDESFRFGPSKVFRSKLKIKLLLRIGSEEEEISFFVIAGSF